MAAPRVSIITPTLNRPQFLPLLAQCVLDQSISDFEWLILDDSSSPSAFMQGLSEPRIKYEHIGGRMTLGAKRNYLVEKSGADVIAQFDDDDFYGREYLSTMLSALNDNAADIVKLFGFFLWSKRHRKFGYWDLTLRLGPHWVWSSSEPANLVVLTEQNNAAFKDNHLGFGFSYVFRKKVWDFSRFAEADFNEEGPFMVKALQRFKLAGIQDRDCLCLHVLHETNASRCFPQYVLPDFLIHKCFPKAAALLAI